MNLSKQFEKFIEGVELPSAEEVKQETLSAIRSQTAKNLSYNPKWIAGQMASHETRKISNTDTWNTPEKLEEGRARTQSRWDDPEFHEKTTKRILEAVNSEQVSATRNTGIKEYWEKEYSGERKGSGNSNYKGVSVGTSIADGSEVRFNVQAEMRAAGFSPAKIYDCINGNIKQHRGYTWRREK
jgi:hypothetical protein